MSDLQTRVAPPGQQRPQAAVADDPDGDCGAGGYYIETWGCQMNELDSQRLAGLLRRRGLAPVASAAEASVFLLNTCSVREGAVHKLYSRLGELKSLKQARPEMLLGVCGCVAQQEGDALFRRAPQVDFVIGTGSVSRLPEILDEIEGGRSRQVALAFDDARGFDYLGIQRESRVRAMVTIIEGCSLNCTFCVVPYTRGPERSRLSSDILEETRGLVAQGYPEVQLLGQTVDAYRDPETGRDFAGLLREVSATPGLRRLRFITSHPKYFTSGVIAAIRECENICPYIHLPVQSGSNRVLRRMHRQYTREEYLRLVEEIRVALPEVNLTTDVIVGFCGETEEDFLETLSLIETVRFGSIFSFKYSPRPNTAALRLKEGVSDAEMTERLTRLNERQREIEGALQRDFLGNVLDVLVDGPSRIGRGQLTGRSPCNRIVNFEGREGIAAGDFVRVEIREALGHSLSGVAFS